tara:strand:+ start:575 stop:1759 length:1185 start_codon:yes stop_codon:yes gene_type:complete
METSLRGERVRKLKKLKEPYPAVSNPKALKGRLRSIRKHGGSVFAHIDKQQVFLKKDLLGEEKFDEFVNLFDIGDIIQVTGKKFKTKSGEDTIEVKDFKMLSKALIGLPDKWSGLKDKEIRFRKRYLDLLMNDEAKEVILKRSEIITKIRSFLDKNDFLEVQTPILQPLYGGASAKPFKTHLNALKMDLYLRVAPELYLKRLLVGGLEKVYEIGRCFRNEGMDRSHNPDFTMLEFYSAYWDWEDVMKFTEDMLSQFGVPKKWDVVEYDKVVGDKDDKEVYKKFKRPTWVKYLPNMPLAKNGEAVQGVIDGLEVVKIFTEQNNPEEQVKAFKDQEKMAKSGKEETQPMDKDFVEALEHGMPPAGGCGIGIDRLSMILTKAGTLRETILFPTMKKK